MPQLEPQPLDANERLRVVASTNILADVVAQIGGDAIDLTALMPPGVDPHGFEPTPQDRIALEKAHVVFVNGLGLEESMLSVLESSDGSGVIVPVNTGFAVLELDNETDHEDHADEDHGHEHGSDDPHTWFSVHAVEQWVENVEHVLSELDPENAETYAANAEGYRSELENLEGELAAMVAELLPEQRKMVTDHDSFGYFADEYDFQIIGTVMPSLSTMASPSAAQLAQLHDQIEAQAIKAIFVGTTVNPDVAQSIAGDTGAQIVMLYTGSLSDADGPADSYLDFMRYNVRAIVEALK